METTEKNGEITDAPQKDPKTGLFLPGNKMGGNKKGAVHSRTMFENYLKERVLVKRKILKELEDGTLSEEDVQEVMTRWEALMQAQYEKAVEKGDGFLMTWIGDQLIGKATQTTKIEGAVPVRGFELDPKQEEKVDDQFSVEQKVEELVKPIIEEQHANSTESFSITEEDTKSNEGGTQAA